MAVNLDDGAEAIIMSLYAHTDAYPIEEMRECIADVHAVLRRCVRDSRVILLGDLNMRIGSLSVQHPQFTSGLLRGKT
eukprot:5339888-Amphidinium_carterae.1